MMSVEVLTGPEGQSVPGQTTEELSELPQFPHPTLCVPMRPKGLHRLVPACGKAISALLGKSERTFPRSGRTSAAQLDDSVLSWPMTWESCGQSRVWEVHCRDK